MSVEYLIRRVGFVIVVLLFVSLLIFCMTQVLPGNAAQMILGEHAVPEQVAALSARLGLDRPAWQQYGSWLWGIVSGNWGVSLSTGQPVAQLTLDALGRSAILGAVALTLVTLIAIPLGVVAADHQGRLPDLTISAVSYVGVALPEFVTATLLLVVFARPEVGLFPAGGYVSLADGGLGGFLGALALPTAALAIVMVAHISRQTRSEMVEVLQSDYVRTAHLKGLSRRVVLWRHALPNSLLPAITVIALDVGYLIGGILVVEEVFAWPGIGRLMIFAIQNRDLPVIQSIALIISAIYAVTNLVADVCYVWLDRRIQYE